MPNAQLLAKGGLTVLVIVSIAILIERLTDARSYWVTDVDDDSNEIVMINTTISPSVDIVETIFDRKISKCLAEYAEYLKFSYYRFRKSSSPCLPHGKCIHKFLIDLSILLESLDVKLQLLEPNLLFCLLPSSRKYNLLTRGITSSKVLGSRNVVTFGIHQSETKILDEARSRKKIISAGYRILKFRRWIVSKDELEGSDEFSHYFIFQDDMLIHLIVFYSRGTYLWSPGFNTSEIDLKGLQYVNNRAFENFTISPIHLDTLSTANIFLPSDARCFLLDMMSSNFLECEAHIIPNVNTNVQMALKELKVILASRMVSFWLWSKTLQGWFENCDIIHYSEELKFSVAATSVEGFNFTALFDNSACQLIESNFNLNTTIKNVTLDCFKVSVDLIFMYEDKVKYWYEYVDGDNTYKLNFLKFTLCSTDVYGEKIGIPCETSEIFEGEYGQFLKNTTLSLDPEKMKNVQLMDQT